MKIDKEERGTDMGGCGQGCDTELGDVVKRKRPEDNVTSRRKGGQQAY